jgi:short subunit dehydrogenase-like uncharacterized protein
VIVIYGASGLTGSLVAQSLLDHELDFVVAGRDRSRLESVAEKVGNPEIRSAPVYDVDALARIFDDADVVINCAGPFGAIGEPVVRAALQADCHYLDTTGEQEFVRNTYERFESASTQAKRVIVNACAFEVALGDWAANLAAAALDTEHADSITISYAVDQMSPTKGTRLSILDALGKQGYAWASDRWVPVSPGSQRLEVDYPEPFGPRTALSFPSPEVITVPRHSPAHHVQTYMSIGPDTPITRAASMIAPIVSPLMTPLLGSILRSGLGAMAHSALEATVPADAGHERTSRFAIVAEATYGDQSARCSLSGVDIYGVSAGIACLAAERLQNEGKLAGVLAPSQILAPQDALEEISEQHDIILELP